jgi:hypothetical protein
MAGRVIGSVILPLKLIANKHTYKQQHFACAVGDDAILLCCLPSVSLGTRFAGTAIMPATAQRNALQRQMS